MKINQTTRIGPFPLTTSTAKRRANDMNRCLRRKTAWGCQPTHLAERDDYIQRLRSPALRSGTVLVIVLIVVALLALGAYTFAEFMTIEAKATATFGREVQARALADSGI